MITKCCNTDQRCRRFKLVVFFKPADRLEFAVYRRPRSPRQTSNSGHSMPSDRASAGRDERCPAKAGLLTGRRAESNFKPLPPRTFDLIHLGCIQSVVAGEIAPMSRNPVRSGPLLPYSQPKRPGPRSHHHRYRASIKTIRPAPFHRGWI